MQDNLQRIWKTVALSAALALSGGCGSGDEGFPEDTLRAQAAIKEAIAMLELGQYREAKLALNDYVVDTATAEYRAISRDPKTHNQGRLTYVLAATFDQVNAWADTLGTVLGLVDGLNFSSDGNLIPLVGDGLIPQPINSLLTRTDRFFSDLVTVLEPVKRQADFELRLRSLPVRIGELDLLEMGGRYDLGEVYLIDSVLRLAIGAVAGIYSLDYTVRLEGEGLRGLGYLLDQIGTLDLDSLNAEFAETVFNVIGVVLYTQERLLHIGDVPSMQRAGQQFGDSMESFIQSLNFIRGETGDQSNDLVAWYRDGSEQGIQLNATITSPFVPGVDVSKLQNLRIPVTDEIDNSLGNIRDSLKNSGGARVSWSRDLVPLISLVTVTLLRTGAFNGLIQAAFDSGEVGGDLENTVNNLLNSNLLNENLVAGLLRGVIGDVFEFDLGAYFAAPVGPRLFLPFYSPPATVPVYGSDGTTVTGWQNDFSTIRLLVEFECDDGVGNALDAPQAGFLCDAADTVDLPHFSTGVVTSEAFIDWWSSSQRNLIDNLRKLEGDELGIPADGFRSPLPYLGFMDASLGNMIHVNLRPYLESSNEAVPAYYDRVYGGAGVDQWVKADMFTLNAVLGGIFLNLPLELF